MRKRILSQCLKISLDTIDKHSQKRFLHWSFIIQYNKIIEWATNMTGTPPVHFGYHSRIKNEQCGPKIHAELAAWKKAKGLIKGGPFECINIRLNKNRAMRNSQPCSCCFGFLSDIGCTGFWFTTNDGWCKIV